MSNFTSFTMTDLGRAIVAKGNAEQENAIVYTKFVCSQNRYTQEQLSSLENIEGIKQEIPVSSASYKAPDIAAVSGKISSSELEKGYYLQTIGVYAKNKIDNIEKLYAVTIDIEPDKADWIPPKSSLNVIDTLITANFVIAEAQISKIEIVPGGTITIDEFNDFKNTTTTKIIEIDGKLDELNTRVTVLEGKIADGIDAKNSIVLYEAGKTYKAGQLVYTIEEVPDKITYEGAEVEVIDEWVQVPKNPKNKVLQYTITLTRDSNMTKKTWSPPSNNNTNWDDSFFGIGRWGLPTDVWKVRQPGEIVFTLMDDSTYTIKGWFNNWRDQDAAQGGYYKYFYFVNTTRKVVPGPNLYLDYPEGHTRPGSMDVNYKEYGGYHKNEFMFIYYISNGYGLNQAPDKVRINERQPEQLVKKLEIYTYEY